MILFLDLIFRKGLNCECKRDGSSKLQSTFLQPVSSRLCNTFKLDQAIPIIAMSGTPWLLKNSNFDAVIAKPFCKEEMLDMVRQFIQGPEPQ